MEIQTLDPVGREYLLVCRKVLKRELFNLKNYNSPRATSFPLFKAFVFLRYTHINIE